MLRSIVSTIISIATAAALHPALAFAGDVVIRATEYSSSHDILLTPIGVEADSLLIGLDYPGEWVEYHFSLEGFGYHTAHLFLMGALAVPFDISMTLTGDDSHMSQQCSFEFIGTGFS